MVLPEKLTIPRLVRNLHFMEHEDLSPHSQELSLSGARPIHPMPAPQITLLEDAF